MEPEPAPNHFLTCFFACAHFPWEGALRVLARSGPCTAEGPGLSQSPPLPLVGLGPRRGPSRPAVSAPYSWKPTRAGQPKVREAGWESGPAHLRDRQVTFTPSVPLRPRPSGHAPLPRTLLAPPLAASLPATGGKSCELVRTPGR